MSDLIRREDAINCLEKEKKLLDIMIHHAIGGSKECELLISHLNQINSDINELENLPNVKPEERKIGTWIDGMLYYDFDESEWEKVKCSVCGNFVTKQIFYYDNKYHYCPYCGADMKGENE